MFNPVNLKENTMKRYPEVLVGIIFFTVALNGCGDTTEPEQRINQFFDIELKPGDVLSYRDANSSLVAEGPEVVMWEYSPGELFMMTSSGRVRVRPIGEQAPVEPTPEQISMARNYYTDVPFINEYLDDVEDPSDEQWYEAYVAWLDAMAQVRSDLREQYWSDSRPNRAALALELASTLDNHVLVKSGTVSVSTADQPFTTNQIIWLQWQGVPDNADGTPHLWFIVLTSNTGGSGGSSNDTITQEEALGLHHDIYRLFLASADRPLRVDISTGLHVSNLEER
jgi:hypothetical protein